MNSFISCLSNHGTAINVSIILCTGNRVGRLVVVRLDVMFVWSNRGEGSDHRIGFNPPFMFLSFSFSYENVIWNFSELINRF